MSERVPRRSSGPREPTRTQLRSLIDLSPDGIFIAGPDGRLNFVNETCCRMVGYAAAEIVGRSIGEFVPQVEIARLLESKTSAQDGPTHAGVWSLRCKGGTFMPVEVNAAMFADGSWQGYVRDISERKARDAEREILLEQTEVARQWLQAVLDALPVGVVLHHPDGKLSFNGRAVEMLGMRISTARGNAQYADRIRFPDGTKVPRDRLLAARVLASGETIVGEEYLIVRPDGTQLPTLSGAAPICDAEGRVVGLVAAFQDASERMQMDAAIRRNERLLQSIVELLPIGLWIADSTGQLVTSNPAAQRIWGGGPYVSREEYRRYKGWWVDTGNPIEADEWGMARAIAGETSTGELIRIQCFDGTFKTIIHSAAPLHDDDGAIVGGIVVNEDITALHQAQEEQRASEHLLRTVFELLPVGLLVTDKDGHIRLANPASEGTWAGSRYVGPEQYGEYKGWWVETGKRIEPEEWGLARAIRSGETSHSELIRIQCFDGSYKTIISWAAPIRSDAGEIVGAVAVNEDVTSLQHGQEQLRAVVRDREELLAIVAHDLRNPLHRLLLGATTAEEEARRLPGADDLCLITASLVEIADGMSGLVDDLFAVAVMRAGGRSMIKPAFVPASLLIARAADAARPLFAKASLRLDVDVRNNLPLVSADVDRVLRVFSNLLDNALKYTPAPGRVTLTGKATAAGVLFSVANSGTALPAAELEGMFRPFWQAIQDKRGAGLGLSISRSIVEAHGGSIWAEPVDEGRVRVCFVLPRPSGP